MLKFAFLAVYSYTLYQCQCSTAMPKCPPHQNDTPAHPFGPHLTCQCLTAMPEHPPHQNGNYHPIDYAPCPHHLNGTPTHSFKPHLTCQCLTTFMHFFTVLRQWFYPLPHFFLQKHLSPQNTMRHQESHLPSHSFIWLTAPSLVI